MEFFSTFGGSTAACAAGLATLGAVNADLEPKRRIWAKQQEIKDLELEAKQAEQAINAVK